MDKPMTEFGFKAMSFFFRFRDFFQPRKKVLAEVNIESGFNILDYGCGPGSYAVAAAKLVGETGMVYALDIHPLAVKQVRKTAASKGLANIETILSDCATGLPDESIDVVLFYDTLHKLNEPDKVLAELHRVLKPDGILSFSDHHLKENEMISRITGKGLFQLSRKGEKVYNFAKVG
ncbi:2-methoxy-6-polyprenyl-1,4-benzoquinol methylase [subsurface metagenome]